ASRSVLAAGRAFLRVVLDDRRGGNAAQVTPTVGGRNMRFLMAIMVTQGAAMQTGQMTANVYDGEPFSGSNWPEPLYSITVTTEKGPSTDRLRFVSVDRHGRQFLTQTIDFDGESPRAYVFANSVMRQEGKLSVTSKELFMEFTEG